MVDQSKLLSSRFDQVPSAIKENAVYITNVVGMAYHSSIRQLSILIYVIPPTENLHEVLDQTQERLESCVKEYVEHTKEQTDFPIAQELRNAVMDITLELSRHGGLHLLPTIRFWFTEVTSLNFFVLHSTHFIPLYE